MLPFPTLAGPLPHCCSSLQNTGRRSRPALLPLTTRDDTQPIVPDCANVHARRNRRERRDRLVWVGRKVGGTLYI